MEEQTHAYTHGRTALILRSLVGGDHLYNDYNVDYDQKQHLIVKITVRKEVLALQLWRHV